MCVLQSVFYSVINCISVTFSSSLVPVLTSSGANYGEKALSSISERFKESFLLLLLQTGGWGQLWRTKQGIQNLSNEGFYVYTCTLLLLCWVVFCFLVAQVAEIYGYGEPCMYTSTIGAPLSSVLATATVKKIFGSLLILKWEPYVGKLRHCTW